MKEKESVALIQCIVVLTTTSSNSSRGKFTLWMRNISGAPLKTKLWTLWTFRPQEIVGRCSKVLSLSLSPDPLSLSPSPATVLQKSFPQPSYIRKCGTGGASHVATLRPSVDVYINVEVHYRWNDSVTLDEVKFQKIRWIALRLRKRDVRFFLICSVHTDLFISENNQTKLYNIKAITRL